VVNSRASSRQKKGLKPGRSYKRQALFGYSVSDSDTDTHESRLTCGFFYTHPSVRRVRWAIIRKHRMWLSVYHDRMTHPIELARENGTSGRFWYIL